MEPTRARHYGSLGTFYYVKCYEGVEMKGERTIEDTDRIGALEQVNAWNRSTSKFKYYLLPILFLIVSACSCSVPTEPEVHIRPGQCYPADSLGRVICE